MRFPGQQRKRRPLAGLDSMAKRGRGCGKDHQRWRLALRLDAFSLRDQSLESLLYPAIPRCCAPRSGEKLTCGICLDSVGQQVDISVISGLRRMPISQDSLSIAMGQHRGQTEKILP